VKNFEIVHQVIIKRSYIMLIGIFLFFTGGYLGLGWVVFPAIMDSLSEQSYVYAITITLFSIIVSAFGLGYLLSKIPYNDLIEIKRVVKHIVREKQTEDEMYVKRRKRTV
jgi:hypothetical protein